MKKVDDPNEDKRIKGSWWSYWNNKTRQYEGPEMGRSILCYSTWTMVPKKEKKTKKRSKRKKVNA